MSRSLVCAGPSAGTPLPLGCWWTGGLESFLPKLAWSVLRKPHPRCSFCLHCTSQGRAPCLHQGWALWGPMSHGDTGASQLWAQKVNPRQVSVLSVTSCSVPKMVTVNQYWWPYSPKCLVGNVMAQMVMRSI